VPFLGKRVMSNFRGRPFLGRTLALTFVRNEKTLDLPDILAQCLVILAPSFWIIRMVILRRSLFLDTMDF